MSDIGKIEGALTRHGKIALQLSGGRDSIACLYLMRGWLDKITVYWLNTGAAFPETVSLMSNIRSMCPNFVEVTSNQPAYIEENGIPSDIVPSRNTVIGIAGEGVAPLIQDRYTCCANVIMLPLHQRMIDDGTTLIIRGQKSSDRLKGQLNSGDMVDGIEYLYPIEKWESRDVMEYLKQEKAPIPRFYQMLNGAPDCMTCSAYWEEGVSHYLKRYHHDTFRVVQEKLTVICEAVGESISAFNNEINV